MVSNAAALLLASEVNLLENYWKLKIIPISHTAANNKLLILSWLEELCGLPEQDNYLATLSRPHQAAFRGVHLPLSPQSLIIWCPGEDLENFSPHSQQKAVLCVAKLLHPQVLRAWTRLIHWSPLAPDRAGDVPSVAALPGCSGGGAVQPLYLSMA